MPIIAGIKNRSQPEGSTKTKRRKAIMLEIIPEMAAITIIRFITLCLITYYDFDYKRAYMLRFLPHLRCLD